MSRRLSPAEVMWIRWAWTKQDDWYNTRSMAKRFGLSEYTIREILNNRVYRDLYVEDCLNVPDAFWRTDDPEQQLTLLLSMTEEETQ